MALCKGVLYDRDFASVNVSDVRAHTVPRGGAMTVLRIAPNGYRHSNAYVEIKNQEYQVFIEAAENFIPKLNEDGTVAQLPKEKPEEFNRDMPFEATVTENIQQVIQLSINSTKNVSIPARAKVTVKGEYSLHGISQANVTYDGQDNIYVYWKYLKPVD